MLLFLLVRVEHFISLLCSVHRRFICSVESLVSFSCVQSVTGQSKSTSPVAPGLLRLEDFYMTNTISRASPTMAKCIQAVSKQRESKYN